MNVVFREFYLTPSVDMITLCRNDSVLHTLYSIFRFLVIIIIALYIFRYKQEIVRLRRIIADNGIRVEDGPELSPRKKFGRSGLAYWASHVHSDHWCCDNNWNFLCWFVFLATLDFMSCENLCSERVGIDGKLCLAQVLFSEDKNCLLIQRSSYYGG